MDAWQQHYELLEKYTPRVKVRSDLEVVACGTDRSVRLVLWDETPDRLGPRTYKETQRNVSTMRELAQALNDACDFVEAVNPEWTEHGKRLRA